MSPREGQMRPNWVLLMRRGSEDTLYDAAAMTAAAVSLGLSVTLIWFGEALEALASGRLAESQEEERGAGRLFREARETGSVRSLACSASPAVRRLDEKSLSALVDGVVGWPTAISLIRAAERTFVW